MNVNVGILNQLAAYFRGELKVEELRDFMVGQYLNSDSLADDDKKFLSEFEGCYAELSDQLISEPLFKDRMASLHAGRVDKDF